MSQVIKTEIEIDSTKTYSGLPVPKDWHIVDRIYNHPFPHPDDKVMGYTWQRMTGQAISVMEDIETKDDGLTWLHISVAKPNNKMPTYEDIQIARKLFIGEHRECYMVFPTEDRYVNFNNVLHLWSCLDKPDGVLPHFEKMVNGKLSI